jgi:hypothetical protein
VIFDTKTPFLIKFGQENHSEGSVNSSNFGENILRGILGPRRARGVPRGWGWGAVPAGLLLHGPELRQYKKIPVMISGPLIYAWEVIDFFNYSQNIRF